MMTIAYIIFGSVVIVFEIILGLIIFGWTLPFSAIALFADLFTGGCGEPWKSKHKWIRYLSTPFLKMHYWFCKIQGLKQVI